MNIEKSVGAVIKYQSPSSKLKDPEFLLLRNRRGYWGFPQGHKEEGETEIQTLFREVYEETGINSLNIYLLLAELGIHFSKVKVSNREKKLVSITLLLILEI